MVMPKDAGPFPVKMVNTEMYLPLSDVQEWWICASETPWFLRPFCKGSRNWGVAKKFTYDLANRCWTVSPTVFSFCFLGCVMSHCQ